MRVYAEVATRSGADDLACKVASLVKTVGSAFGVTKVFVSHEI